MLLWSETTVLFYEHVYSPKIGRKTIKKKRGQTDMYRDKSIKT